MSENAARDAEIEARLNLVEQRYGHRIPPDKLDDVREAVAAIVESAEAMRAVDLDNSDEPLSLFLPYRGEG